MRARENEIHYEISTSTTIYQHQQQYININNNNNISISTTINMDIIRHKFLRAQLSAVVPPEIVSYIQEYDTIYRDLYTKHIVCNIPERVRDFWYKHAEICKLGFEFGQMDVEKMYRYIFYYNHITIFVLPTVRIDYINKKSMLSVD